MSKDYLRAFARALKARKGEEIDQLLRSSPLPASALLSELRSLGAFRSSRQGYNAAIPARLVAHFRDGPLSVAEGQYMDSVESLLAFAPAVGAAVRKFSRTINARSLKSYVVSVDELFHPVALARALAGEDATPFGREEIASLLSLYYHLLRDQGTSPTIFDLFAIHPKKIRSGYYLHMLRQLRGAVMLREAEIHVDHFDYRAAVVGKTLTVSAPDAAFEKAYRLGYIRHAQQNDADHLRAFDDLQKLPTLYDAVQSVLEVREDMFFQKVETDLRRVTIRMPDDERMYSFFRQPTLHREEALQLLLLSKELFVSIEDLLATVVSRDVRLSDVLMVQRLFQFGVIGLHLFCEKHGLLGTEYFYNGVGIIVVNATGGDVLERLFGREKAVQLLELLSWDPASETVFDVQYQPIFRVGDFSLIPVGMIATSNLLRNTLQQRRLRLHGDSGEDPVSDELLRALQGAGFNCKARVKYVGVEGPGEIDVLAWCDDRLFVFECKNSLHPCSPFELRASFDCMNKAAEQLNRVRRTWEAGDLAKQLHRAHGIRLSPAATLHTCIGTGNRMFLGLDWQGHPCRPVYELCGFVELGEWWFQSPDDATAPRGRYVSKRWNGGACTVADLAGYLTPEGSYQILFDAMEPFSLQAKCGAWTIVAESFALNHRTLFSRMVQLPHTFMPA